jgi:hypothetical protein
MLFDSGFHCDRGGTAPLALLAVFLEAKIALRFIAAAGRGNKILRLRK